MRIGRIIALVLAASGLSACESAPIGKFAEVDGRLINYQLLGSGQPVFVVLPGLGNGMSNYQAASLEIARSATVILYDRAGYGKSDRGPAPRDAAAIDRELTGVLRATGVLGPYVLVGHSVGGLYAEYFAARHPDQVAALVLEDARPADFSAKCVVERVKGCSPPPSLMKLAPLGAQDEFDALGDTEKAVRGVSPLRDIPVWVLSRGISAKPTAFEKVWGEGQSSLAERYPGARHLSAPKSDHDIHNANPGWFVAALRQVTVK